MQIAQKVDMSRSNSDRARAHIFVSGRVQGVFYRATTRERAASLDLVGWVRNCADGRVEIVAEGARADLEKLRAWCEEGPPRAQVSDVAVSWSDPTGEFHTFDVER